jgi:hypothetical protein
VAPKIDPLTRWTLGPSLVVAVCATGFCACSNSAGNRYAPVTSQPALKATHKQTFNYTGHKQTFVVPTGVTNIAVTASGASGGVSNPDSTAGTGGLVRAAISVTPGETLEIYVGGSGAGGGAGGYNGGSNGGVPYNSAALAAAGGGGASDVRQRGPKFADRVIVAGGGGGAGLFGGYYGSGTSGDGGRGGRKTGQRGGVGCCENNSGSGGSGGSQTTGGSGGAAGDGGAKGAAGSIGTGGAGGSGFCNSAGGGAGGGYFGGGGGGGAGYCYSYSGGGGGGAGGSSYVEPGAMHVVDRRGAAPLGNGSIVITWKP